MKIKSSFFMIMCDNVCFTPSLLFFDLFTGLENGILTGILGISSEPPEFDVVSSGKGDGTKEGEASECEDEDEDEKGDRLRSLTRKSSFFSCVVLLMFTYCWAIFCLFCSARLTATPCPQVGFGAPGWLSCPQGLLAFSWTVQ